MEKTEPTPPPKNIFDLGPDEVYAGISRADWEVITGQLKLFKPVNPNDMELEDRTCTICQECFDLSCHDSCSEPVALPCGHVFGQGCIRDWITVSNKSCFDEFLENVDSEQPVWGADTDTYVDLLPGPGMFTKENFSCPMCRQEFTLGTCTESRSAIVARLRVWDDAYKKLGIVRSAEEEVCRKEIWHFASKAEAQFAENSPDQVHSVERRAQAAAMRSALRRVQQPHTAGQHRLIEAFFKIVCYGINDTPEAYRADADADTDDDENRPIPLWCWQLDRLDRGLNPSCGPSRE